MVGSAVEVFLIHSFSVSTRFGVFRLVFSMLSMPGSDCEGWRVFLRLCLSISCLIVSASVLLCILFETGSECEDFYVIILGAFSSEVIW